MKGLCSVPGILRSASLSSCACTHAAFWLDSCTGRQDNAQQVADTLHSAVSDQWHYTLHLAFQRALQGSPVPIPVQPSQMIPERKLQAV